MAAPEKGPIIPEEAIRRLPRWANVAILARCALRLLPAITYHHEDDYKTNHDDIQMAYESCLLPLYCSVTGSDRYQAVAALVAETLRKGPLQFDTLTMDCIASAAEVSAENVQTLPAHVLSAIGAYQRVGENYNSASAFEAALRQDVLAVGKFVRETQLVDAAFFARPLWEGTELTSEWQSVADIWLRFIRGIGLSVLGESYSELYTGKGVVIEAVPGLLDKWSPPPPASNAIPNPPPASPSPSPAPPPQPAAAVPTKIPDVWMLADRPLEDHFDTGDLLRFKDYASALATILDHEKTDTPFTMAINAPWGAGKTTLANMVAAELEQRPRDRGQEPHIICKFNAWMNDGAPNLATAFVAEVSRTANRHRRWIRRIFWPLPWAVLYPSSRRWRQVALGIVVVVLALALSWWLGAHLQQIEEATNKDGQRQVVITKDPSGKEIRTETVTRPEKTDSATPLNPVDRLLKTIESRVGVLGAFFTALAGLIGLLLKVVPSLALGGFVESPEKAAEAGAIQAAEKQLGSLIEQATYRKNRFVVFVDDIERCTPPRSIDVLDAINQLMDHKNVVVVLLGDMAAVAAAAQLKYKDLAEIYVPNAGIALTGPDRGKEAFGRLYLQKIIQFQFDLPIPGKEKIQDYMRHLAVTRDTKGEASGAGTT